MDRGQEDSSSALQDIAEQLRRTCRVLELEANNGSYCGVRRGMLISAAAVLLTGADMIVSADVTPNRPEMETRRSGKSRKEKIDPELF